MIKNERQYRVTSAQLKTFEKALEEIASAELPAGVDPGMREVHQKALRSQHDELRTSVQEYEALQRGDLFMFEIDDFAQLPTALIKARIASRLTQKELAERLGGKEQQVQRWEANDYAGASLETLQSVMNALGIQIRKELFVPTATVRPKDFLAYIEERGISRSLLNRLIPAADAAKFEQDGPKAGFKELITAATRISRVFKTDVHDVLHMRPVDLASGLLATPRFKRLTSSRRNAVDSYIVYVHYLAATLEMCSPDVARTPPSDFRDWHTALSSENEPMTFRKALEFAWDHGIIVLPLRETGKFHGAVWKIRNRPTVILKQTTELESRWLYDLLHEVAHAVKGHVTDDVGLIEENPISQEADDPEEEEANDWAEDVIFNGRSEEIEVACAAECRGNLRKLKSAIGIVAKKFNINAGALANHMAFRLSSEGEDWWGAAHNVQEGSESPYEIARSVLFERVRLDRTNAVDRELVIRALSDN